MTEGKMIASLDISTRTGWCCGRVGANAQPTGGVWTLGKLKDADGHLQLGMLNSSLMSCVQDMIAEFMPDLVVFEAPISRAQTTDRMLKYLCGAVETVCYEMGVMCREVSSFDARKLIIGRGSFQKPFKGAGVEKWRGQRGKGNKIDPKLPKVRMLVGDAKQEVAIYMQSIGWSGEDDNHLDALLLWRFASALSRARVTAGNASLGVL